ncbi:IclR family transcriptional regulator [Streptomyces spongiae]|uniref:Helix-turn-helix domain-containing protein n=1 Tax=Streptomyces spongiae TaxID=565072 RepID=A0A5N8XJK8_9ACTN|nr:IclR family transcriptional regulator C-terminal domain-containing protein [Streptomyces spongiae]MPY59527.1 helix-turn-helix domain-containing protein [Streptomyces spongiae]
MTAQHVMVGEQPEPDGGELPAYHIASVGRALTLLTAFIERSQLTVSEAADLLDVAPSTAHRLLQMLLHHHFVEQGERRVYVRGPALGALTEAGNRPPDVESVALPHLRHLRDELHGTAHLLALEGNGARFLMGAEWRDETRIASSRVGWLLPAHTLAGGKAMLAKLSRAQIEALFPDGLPVTRYARVRTPTQLQAELADVRSRGYARSREAHENVTAIGVALPLRPGARLMAVSVAWSDTRFPNRQECHIVDALQTAVQKISSELTRLGEDASRR